MNKLLTGLTILAILTFVHWSRLPHGQLIIDFLDIGQGDSVLLSLPTGERILIDGGPEQYVLQELGEVMPFMERRIDLMILSHPHADHMMGLIQVMKRYEVGAVLFSGVNYWSPIYDEFLKEVREQKILLMVARADEDFTYGEVELDVIFPFEEMLGEEISNVNNASVGVMVKFGEHRILLTGDLEEEAEEELVEHGVDLKADVFKAGHHGSRTSSSQALLDLVQPELIIIQSGEGNSYEHPHPESLQKFSAMGIEVRRNDLEGRIRLRFDAFDLGAQ
jgi:competence protein ComEC